MPLVTLRSETPDNKESMLRAYICDMVDCPNPAEHVLRVVRGFGTFAVCPLHKRMLEKKNDLE